MILLVYVVPVTLGIALMLTAPVWLVRRFSGRCWGLYRSEMSIWRALGDVAFVFTGLLALAHAGELYPPFVQCFSLLGACKIPGSNLLFAWGFFFQVATIPVGVPVFIFACSEVIRRLRYRRRRNRLPRCAA